MLRENIFVVPTCVFVTMLIVYTMGCAQSVQGMDAAEFMLVGSLGGRLHPSGYPIATYMMQLFQILPSSNIAFTTSFFSVFFGALALFVQSLGIQYLTQNKILSFVLPILLGCSPLWLRYCTVAEVFASAGFALSCLVLLSILIYQKRISGSIVGVYLGILGGFAFANHHSFAFAWPMIFWVLWRGNARLRGVLYTIAFGFWGVLAYIPLLYADGPWMWGDFQDISGLIDHILRRDYGTFTLRAGETTAHWFENPVFYLNLLPEEFLIWPLAFLVLAFTRQKYYELSIVLTITWISIGLFFLSLFNISPIGEASVIAQRFMLSPSVLLLPLIAIGLNHWMSSRLVQSLIVLTPALPFIFFVGQVEHSQDRRLENFLTNACSATPDNSVVFVRGDGITFGMIYAQDILNICTEVVPISPNLLQMRWYQNWLRNRYQNVDLSSVNPQEIIKNNSNFQFFASIGLMGDPAFTSQMPPFVPYRAVWTKFIIDPSRDNFPTPPELEEEYWSSLKDYSIPKKDLHPFLHRRTAEVWATNQYGISLNVIASGYRSFGMPERAEQLQLLASLLLDGEIETFWKQREMIQSK